MCILSGGPYLPSAHVMSSRDRMENSCLPKPRFLRSACVQDRQKDTIRLVFTAMWPKVLSRVVCGWKTVLIKRLSFGGAGIFLST